MNCSFPHCQGRVVRTEVDLRSVVSGAIGSAIVYFIALIAQPAEVLAQQAAIVQQSSRPSGVSWSLSAGPETLELRDIARTGTPVDASPVAWRASGPTFRLNHRRIGGTRIHRFDLSAMWTERFAYRTPVETITRSKSDSFRSVEARYEYRRYLFSNALVHGLDFGAGVQGGTGMWWLARDIEGGLRTTESRPSVMLAIAAAVRFRREGRFGVEVSWANGGHIGRSREHHSADLAASRTRWGGGWLTDLVISADVAMSRRASIGVQYFHTDDWLMSSHRSFMSLRHSVTVGVTYAK